MADRTDDTTTSWDLSRPKRFPLHVHISLLFTILLLVTGVLIGVANYAGSKNGLTEASREHFERLAELTEINLDRLQTPVSALVALLSRTVLVDARSDAERRERLPLLLEALSSNPFMAAVYAGYDDGDFFIVRHLQSARENEVFDAVPGTRFLVQSMERGSGAVAGRYTFLDSEKKEIASRPMTDLGFDPRARPWFREALRQDGVVRTAPYVFYATRDVGQTFACRASHGRAVVGADITLSLLSQNVADMRPTPSARLFVFDREGRIVADSSGTPASRTDDGGNPILLRLGDSPDSLVRRVGEMFLANASATAAEIAFTPNQVISSPVPLTKSKPYTLPIR